MSNALPSLMMYVSCDLWFAIRLNGVRLSALFSLEHTQQDRVS